MRRSRVESTTVYSVGYDAKAGILELEFCSGAIYQYFGVAAKEYQELLAAPSRGSTSTFTFEIATHSGACQG